MRFGTFDGFLTSERLKLFSSLDLIQDPDPGPWTRTLIQDPDPWPWSRTLIRDLDPGPWSLTLIQDLDPGTLIRDLDPGPWSLTLIEDPDPGPWSRTLIQNPGQGPWSLTLIQDPDPVLAVLPVLPSFLMVVLPLVGLSQPSKVRSWYCSLAGARSSWMSMGDCLALLQDGNFLAQLSWFRVPGGPENKETSAQMKSRWEHRTWRMKDWRSFSQIKSLNQISHVGEKLRERNDRTGLRCQITSAVSFITQ